MNNMLRKILMSVTLLLATLCGMAQPSGPVEMADKMRADGMIYVVIAVVLTILAGLLFYVYRLDRKITRLEKGAK